jgi:hypothetical protein
MRTLTIEDVNYNVDSLQDQIKKGLTVERFVQRGISEGKYDRFNSKDRDKLLREVYRRVKDAPSTS